MTPKMEAALRAAASADGGLRYTVAGWISPTDPHVYHGPIVVSRLTFDRGFLEGCGRGKDARRVITDAGRKHLQAGAS